MSENPSTDVPAAPPTPPSDTAPPTAAPAAPAAPRLRDRVFRFRAVVAVAAAGVIVGGVTGAGLTAVTDGHGHGRSQPGRFGFGQGPGMPGGMPGMPGGQGFPIAPGQGFQGVPGQLGQPGQEQPGSTKTS